MPRPSNEDNEPIAGSSPSHVDEYAVSKSNPTHSRDGSASVEACTPSSSSPSHRIRSRQSTLIVIALSAATVLVSLLTFLFGDNLIFRSNGIESRYSVRNTGEGLHSADRDLHFHATYSFRKAPFVHPKIIGDLLGMISDAGNEVIAIDLLRAQGSNRYFGEIRVAPQIDPQPPSWPWIYSANRVLSFDGKPNDTYGVEFDAYRYIGSTNSGFNVLHAKWSGGGAGVYDRLIFVHIEGDYGVDYPLLSTVKPSREGIEKPERRNREVIRIVGSIPLGDRWHGTVEIVGDDVVVRGRDLYERCKFGGVTMMEIVEMQYFMDVTCEHDEARDPPPARAYRAPTQP